MGCSVWLRLTLAGEAGPRKFPQFVIHFRQQLAGRAADRQHHRGRSCTERRHYDTRRDRAHQSELCGHLGRAPRAGRALLYGAVRRRAPAARPLFPVDLTSLQGHFEAALALVIRNLEEMQTLEQPLRDSARSTSTGARSPRTT